MNKKPTKQKYYTKNQKPAKNTQKVYDFEKLSRGNYGTSVQKSFTSKVCECDRYMNPKPLTLAIDPSINNTGLALFDGMDLIQVNTLNGYELAIYLYNNLDKITHIVIEDSTKQKACWNRHYRSVGQVDAICNIVEQAIKQYNKQLKANKEMQIKFVEMSPLQKGHKIPKEHMQEIYPQFKITQDISDAIKIGENYIRFNLFGV